MQTLDYNKIQKIEISATEKLLNYISTVIEFENLLEDIEFFYPDFDENKNRIAFNIWLSMDFITNSGKTFIAQFLDEKSTGLTTHEKEILRERDKSNVSLFEIINIDKEFIEVLDLLQNKSYNLWDPELAPIINIDDIIFGRVGNLLGHSTFIGDLNYLPITTKSIFLKQTFIDFNHLRLGSPMLTMKEYLKTHSLNLYNIYTNCMFEAMEMEEDITSSLYDELDEFEAYLQLKTLNSSIRKHMTILMDFFEYYLADEDLTLYDLDEIDLSYFFTEAIQDGFISSHENLNSYISTLKKYIGFLSNMNPEYKDAYKDILDISTNRFNFMKQFKLVKPIFNIERNFSNLVSNLLNEDAISLLMDLDKFILYIIDKPLDLTAKNKHIKRKNLFEIINILETDDYPGKKAPNQEDFPIIDLFFKLTTYLGILSIEGNTLSVSSKGSNYLRLRDEEKYTLFFQYIWGNDFIAQVSKENNKVIIEKLKNDLVSLLSPFIENVNYNISIVLPSFSGELEFLFEYYFHLQYLGILKCNLYPNYEIKLTSLGKAILNFLELKDEKPYECSIISLETFKKSR